MPPDKARSKTTKTLKEEISANLLGNIAGNNLLYHNEDQRRSAYIEARVLSNDYQTARDDERAALTDKTQTEAEIELNIKTYRAKELLMLFYANSPAA